MAEFVIPCSSCNYISQLELHKTPVQEEETIVNHFDNSGHAGYSWLFSNTCDKMKCEAYRTLNNFKLNINIHTHTNTYK